MFIGGTLQGTPQEMARQAAPFRAARPEIAAPVIHYSLSLQAGDGRKTPEEWKPMVEAFLTKIGVPLDAAWTAYLHNDTDHQHCHIAFLRSFGDGEIWNREFSAKRAHQATAEIEKEFGLLTHDRTTRREKKRQSVEEKKFEKQLQKQGKTVSKEHIARQVDDFIESRRGQSYTVDELKSGLADAGIQVEVVERGGAIAGVKFQYEGIWISGSSIGDNYKAQGLLQRGLSGPGIAPE
ncbi:MAG: relaxase/mobilization nuclease domain-containing protein, partial [Curvibacter sp.]